MKPLLHGPFFALLFSALSVSAALAPAQEARLRQLLRMPGINAVTVGVGFSFKAGVIVQGWNDTTTAEAKQVREAIREDSSNPDLYERLAVLYWRADDTNAAATSKKAVALYRVQGADRSKDAATLTRFGRALMNAGQNEEAESVLRKAIKTDAKGWQAWSALSMIQSLHALTNLHAGVTYEINSMPRAIAAARANRFTPEAVKRTEQEFAKAVETADRALSLAPREAQVYEDRLAVDTMGAYLGVMLQLTRGADWDAARIQGEMTIATNTMHDLWRIVELQPDDPKSLAMAALFEFSASNIRSQQADSPAQAVWERMSRDAQDRIRAGVKRMERLGQDLDSAEAQTALEAVGLIQYAVMGDKTLGEQTFKRIFARNPLRDVPWWYLTATAGTSGREREALQYCQTRLEARDDVPVRLALAKLCVKLDRLDEAQTNAAAAVRLDPKGIKSNLAAAVVTLKQSVAHDSLRRAATHFNTIRDTPGFSATPLEERAQYVYNAAILAALGDSLEGARNMIRIALKIDPTDADAQEIQKLILEKR